MATFQVQMPDGSVRQVQGTTLSAALNNAGPGATAAPATPNNAASAAPAAAAPSYAAPTAAALTAGGDTGPVYQTINGPRTAAQMEAELRAVGWGGPAGGVPLGPGSIANAYAQTAGGSVTEMPSQNYGAAAQNQTLQPFAQGLAGLGDIGGQIASALSPFFGQTAGFSREQLAEQKRQFDAQLAWARTQMEQIGLPQLAIQQRLAQMEDEHFKQQLALAQQQQTFQQGVTTAGVTGVYQGSPTLQAQQQAFEQAMGRAGLGLQYLTQAAQLQGPENVFQQANFLRGAQGNPQVPAFLQALQTNARLPAFTAPGTTPPTPASLGGLANRLTGGGSATPGWDQGQTLAAVQNLYNQGAQKLAPGTLERLTPDEMAALGSGIGAIGGTLPAFLQQYQRSRPDQSAMTGDMSLAA